MISNARRACAPPPQLSAHAVIDALNERRLIFARQPVVDARTRETVFCEALARLERPDMPLLAGAEIMPTVERAGLMALLDARMLELATEWLAAHPHERLSVNLSPSTLERPDWLGALDAHLRAHPGVADRLIIEITETSAVRDPAQTRIQLEMMKQLGVRIAIDDFGRRPHFFPPSAQLPRRHPQDRRRLRTESSAFTR